MNSHEEAQKKALQRLRELESVRALNKQEKNKLFPDIDTDIWEIRTEVLNKENKVEDVTMHLLFLLDFPLSFPKILLSPIDFDKTKYLPHVQVDRLICTFENHAQPNANFPEEIAIEAVRRAKRVIEQGLNGIDRIEQFNEEFVAYWNSNYSKKDSVLNSVLLLFEEPIQSEIYVLVLDKPINTIIYIVHQNESISDRFKKFLDERGRKYVEAPAYFVGALNKSMEPPYHLTNKQTIDIVKEIDEQRFQAYKSFLNQKQFPKLVLFSKDLNGEIKYFGWIYKRPELNIKGFRPGKINTFKVLSTFESNKLVSRINPEEYTPRRLIKRSLGIEELQSTKGKIYSLVGLGSIGSNLVHFLKSDQRAEFRLIDSDKLKIENVGRHLLGFNYLGWKKTKAVKDYLQLLLPTRQVSTRETSIFSVINNEAEYINESDVLFIAIGEENIESWIAQQISDGIVNVPTFFIWVEPYLLGGHCIFIHPSNNAYSNFFDEHGMFKFNVIHKDDYLDFNPVLSLREAGCQTNFTPYSSDSVLAFLGSLFSEVSKIVRKGDKHSKSFTWIGNKSIASNLNIRMSGYADQFESESLQMN